MAARVVTTLLIAMVLCSLFSCESAHYEHPSGKTIKVGYIGPLSGKHEGWGHAGLDGVRLALALQPVLKNGDRVDLVLADDENNPELARQALEKLVLEDDVVAVLTISDSQTVLGLATMADRYKIPILALSATHPDVTESTYISQLLFDDEAQGTIAALYVIDELLIEKAAVFKNEADPYSIFLAETFSRRFTDAGGAIEQIVIDNSTADYTTILKHLKDKGIPVLYLPLKAKQVIDIEIANRAIGYDPQVMVGDTLLGQIVVQFKEYLDTVEGIFSTDTYTSNRAFTQFGQKAFKTYIKEFDQRGTTFTLLGCEGAAILFEAIDRCINKANKECINKSLRETKDFVGAYGKISIKSTGKAERAVYVNQIKNGKLRFVVEVY